MIGDRSKCRRPGRGRRLLPSLCDDLYSVNHEFRVWMESVELFNIQKWRVIAISEDGVQALIEDN